MSEIYYEVMRDYTTTVHYNVGVNNSIYHFHQQLELLYVEQGEVEVTINDKKQTITKGQLVIADSFYNHQFIHNENAISHCLIIPVQYLKKYATILSNQSLKEIFILDEKKASYLFSLMQNVVNSLNENELIIEGNISILLGNIIKDNLTVDNDKTSYDLVKCILLYIEENYKSTITLDSIAKHFGYSKYYFSHLFNKCFRCNLNDYLNLVRCRHSISFVIDENMSVADAAFAAGFVSMRTFYRTFKKYFKITPKEYFHRNKNKKSI